MSGPGRPNSNGRLLREPAVIAMLTAPVVIRKVGVVEKSHVRLFVESDFDNIPLVEIKLVM
jgi:hypothetical protein